MTDLFQAALLQTAQSTAVTDMFKMPEQFDMPEVVEIPEEAWTPPVEELRKHRK